MCEGPKKVKLDGCQEEQRPLRTTWTKSGIGKLLNSDKGDEGEDCIWGKE